MLRTGDDYRQSLRDGREVWIEGERVDDVTTHAAFKPTIANWGDDKLSDYAVGFICPMNAKGLKHICRTGFAAVKPAEDYAWQPSSMRSTV